MPRITCFEKKKVIDDAVTTSYCSNYGRLIGKNERTCEWKSRRHKFSLTVSFIYLYLTAYSQMIPSSSLSGPQVRLFNYNPLALYSGNYKSA